MYETISFYRILRRSPVRVETAPYFELKHPAMHHPDGLAFSKEGQWLATANHGANTVTIFSRERPADGPVYGPAPVAEIRDDDLRYPHSVAFTDNGHLVVTNAGANYMKIYQLAAARERKSGVSIECVHKLVVGDDAAFERVNCENKMEGGPKGLAIYGDEIAVCSPEFGIKVYRFKELTAMGAIVQRLGFPATI
jgi:DNA-binding beta-propeller fold protein YncE